MTIRDEIYRIAGTENILQSPLIPGLHGRPSGTMKPLANLLGNAFGDAESSVSAQEVKPSVAQVRLRRKIWELPSGRHCMLVGNCLSVAQLRLLAKRVGLGVAEMSDYLLHTFFVEHCGERSEIAEAVQRLLDQQHMALIRQFARARGGEAVLALWRDALEEGDVAGALWAAWTHPDTGEHEGIVIYGELHMLSHQLVEREHTERQRLNELVRENGALRGEIANLRQQLAQARLDDRRHVAELEKRLAEGERLAARRAQDELVLERANKIEMQNGALRKRNKVLSRRLTDLGQRNAEFVTRIAELNNELAGACNPEQAQAALAAPVDCRTDGIPGDQLAGRRILCIGGRTGLIDRYRRLVEAGGGHFLHHDGGQEENGHRIDDIVANADAVICQVSHVSHFAYWRIKDACKQRQLPCVFLKSGGLTTFARNLKLLAEQKDHAIPPAGRGMFLSRDIGLTS